MPKTRWKQIPALILLLMPSVNGGPCSSWFNTPSSWQPTQTWDVLPTGDSRFLGFEFDGFAYNDSPNNCRKGITGGYVPLQNLDPSLYVCQSTPFDGTCRHIDYNGRHLFKLANPYVSMATLTFVWSMKFGDGTSDRIFGLKLTIKCPTPTNPTNLPSKVNNFYEFESLNILAVKTLSDKFGSIANTNCPLVVAAVADAGYSSNFTHGGNSPSITSASSDPTVQFTVPWVSTAYFKYIFAVKASITDNTGTYSTTVTPVLYTLWNCTNAFFSKPSDNIPALSSGFNYLWEHTSSQTLRFNMYQSTEPIVFSKCFQSLAIASATGYGTTNWQGIGSSAADVTISTQTATYLDLSFPLPNVIQQVIAFKFQVTDSDSMLSGPDVLINWIQCGLATWAFVPAVGDLEANTTGFGFKQIDYSTTAYTYTINNYFASNDVTNCPIYSVEVVPIVGGSATDYTTDFTTPAVPTVTQITNPIKLSIPRQITPTQQMITFRLKATLRKAGSPWVNYSPDIILRLRNCGSVVITAQSPGAPLVYNVPQGSPTVVDVPNAIPALFTSSNPVLCPIDTWTLHNNNAPTYSAYSGGAMSFTSFVITMTNMLPGTHTFFIKAKLSSFTPADYQQVTINVLCNDTLELLNAGPVAYTYSENQGNKLVATATLYNESAYLCPRTYSLLKGISPDDLTATNVSVSSTNIQIDTNAINANYVYSQQWSVWVKATSSKSGIVQYQELKLTLTLDCNYRLITPLSATPLVFDHPGGGGSTSVVDVIAYAPPMFTTNDTTWCPITSTSLTTDNGLYQAYPTTNLQLVSNVITMVNMYPATYNFLVKKGFNSPFTTAAYQKITINVLCNNTVEKFNSVTLVKTFTENIGNQLVYTIAQLWNQSLYLCPMTFQILKGISPDDTTATNVTLDGSNNVMINTNAVTNYNTWDVWVKGTNSKGIVSYQQINLQLILDCNYRQILNDTNPITIQIQQGFPTVMDVVNYSPQQLRSNDTVQCNQLTYSLANNNPPTWSAYVGTDINFNAATNIITMNNMAAYNTYIVWIKGLITGWTKAGYKKLTIYVNCNNTLELLDTVSRQYSYMDQSGSIAVIDAGTFFNQTPTMCRITTYTPLWKVTPTEDSSGTNVTVNPTTHMVTFMTNVLANHYMFFDVWIKASTAEGASNYKYIQFKYQLDCNTRSVLNTTEQVFDLSMIDQYDRRVATGLAWFVNPSTYITSAGRIMLESSDTAICGSAKCCPMGVYSIHNNDPPTYSAESSGKIDYKGVYVYVISYVPFTSVFYIRGQLAGGWASYNYQKVTVNLNCLNKVKPNSMSSCYWGTETEWIHTTWPQGTTLSVSIIENQGIYPYIVPSTLFNQVTSYKACGAFFVYLCPVASFGVYADTNLGTALPYGQYGIVNPTYVEFNTNSFGSAIPTNVFNYAKTFYIEALTSPGRGYDVTHAGPGYNHYPVSVTMMTNCNTHAVTNQTTFVVKQNQSTNVIWTNIHLVPILISDGTMCTLDTTRYTLYKEVSGAANTLASTTDGIRLSGSPQVLLTVGPAGTLTSASVSMIPASHYFYIKGYLSQNPSIATTSTSFGWQRIQIDILCLNRVVPLSSGKTISASGAYLTQVNPAGFNYVTISYIEYESQMSYPKGKKPMATAASYFDQTTNVWPYVCPITSYQVLSAPGGSVSSIVTLDKNGYVLLDTTFINNYQPYSVWIEAKTTEGPGAEALQIGNGSAYQELRFQIQLDCSTKTIDNNTNVDTIVLNQQTKSVIADVNAFVPAMFLPNDTSNCPMNLTRYSLHQLSADGKSIDTNPLSGGSVIITSSAITMASMLPTVEGSDYKLFVRGWLINMPATQVNTVYSFHQINLRVLCLNHVVPLSVGTITDFNLTLPTEVPIYYNTTTTPIYEMQGKYIVKSQANFFDQRTSVTPFLCPINTYTILKAISPTEDTSSTNVSIDASGNVVVDTNINNAYKPWKVWLKAETSPPSFNKQPGTNNYIGNGTVYQELNFNLSMNCSTNRSIDPTDSGGYYYYRNQTAKTMILDINDPKTIHDCSVDKGPTQINPSPDTYFVSNDSTYCPVAADRKTMHTSVTACADYSNTYTGSDVSYNSVTRRLDVVNMLPRVYTFYIRGFLESIPSTFANILCTHQKIEIEVVCLNQVVPISNTLGHTAAVVNNPGAGGSLLNNSFTYTAVQQVYQFDEKQLNVFNPAFPADGKIIIATAQSYFMQGTTTMPYFCPITSYQILMGINPDDTQATNVSLSATKNVLLDTTQFNSYKPWSVWLKAKTSEKTSNHTLKMGLGVSYQELRFNLTLFCPRRVVTPMDAAKPIRYYQNQLVHLVFIDDGTNNILKSSDTDYCQMNYSSYQLYYDNSGSMGTAFVGNQDSNMIMKYWPNDTVSLEMINMVPKNYTVWVKAYVKNSWINGVLIQYSGYNYNVQQMTIEMKCSQLIEANLTAKNLTDRLESWQTAGYNNTIKFHYPQGYGVFDLGPAYYIWSQFKSFYKWPKGNPTLEEDYHLCLMDNSSYELEIYDPVKDSSYPDPDPSMTVIWIDKQPERHIWINTNVVKNLYYQDYQNFSVAIKGKNVYGASNFTLVDVNITLSCEKKTFTNNNSLLPVNFYTNYEDDLIVNLDEVFNSSDSVNCYNLTYTIWNRTYDNVTKNWTSVPYTGDVYQVWETNTTNFTDLIVPRQNLSHTLVKNQYQVLKYNASLRFNNDNKSTSFPAPDEYNFWVLAQIPKTLNYYTPEDHNKSVSHISMAHSITQKICCSNFNTSLKYNYSTYFFDKNTNVETRWQEVRAIKLKKYTTPDTVNLDFDYCRIEVAPDNCIYNITLATIREWYNINTTINSTHWDNFRNMTIMVFNNSIATFSNKDAISLQLENATIQEKHNLTSHPMFYIDEYQNLIIDKSKPLKYTTFTMQPTLTFGKILPRLRVNLEICGFMNYIKLDPDLQFKQFDFTQLSEALKFDTSKWFTANHRFCKINDYVLKSRFWQPKKYITYLKDSWPPVIVIDSIRAYADQGWEIGGVFEWSYQAIIWDGDKNKTQTFEFTVWKHKQPLDCKVYNNITFAQFNKTQFVYTVKPDDTWVIPSKNYKPIFVTQNTEDCPVKVWELSFAKTGGEKALLGGVLEILTTGDIKIDFQTVLALMGKESSLVFYIVGSTGWDDRKYLDVTLNKQKEVKKEAAKTEMAVTDLIVKWDYFSMSLKDMDNQGKIKAAFSTSLDKSFVQDLSLINSTVLKVYLTLTEETLDSLRVQKKDPEDAKKLQWEILKFDGIQLEIKINFDMPKYLSIDTKETLFIELLQPNADQLFVPTRKLTMIDPTRRVSGIKVPKQLVITALTAAVATDNNKQEEKELLDAGQMLLMFITMYFLNQLFGGFRILNLIAFYSTINISYPASLSVLLAQLITLVTMDIVGPDQVFWFLNFEADEAVISDAMADDGLHLGIQLSKALGEVGFDSYNPILNIGGLSFVLAFIMFQMALFAAVDVISFFSGIAYNHYQNIQEAKQMEELRRQQEEEEQEQREIEEAEAQAEQQEGGEVLAEVPAEPQPPTEGTKMDQQQVLKMMREKLAAKLIKKKEIIKEEAGQNVQAQKDQVDLESPVKLRKQSTRNSEGFEIIKYYVKKKKKNLKARRAVKSKIRNQRKRCIELRKTLYFNQFIELGKESLFSMTLAGILWFQQYPFQHAQLFAQQTTTYIWSYIYGIVTFSMSIILFPVVGLLVMLARTTALNKKVFQNSMGSYYEEMKFSVKVNNLYFFLFWFRRVSLALSVLYMYDVPGIQLMLIEYYNLISIVFVGYYSPFKDRPTNINELMNDILIAFYTFFLTCFTDWQPDIETRETTGNICFVLIIFIFLANVYHQFGRPVKFIYLRLVKWKKIAKQWIEKFKVWYNKVKEARQQEMLKKEELQPKRLSKNIKPLVPNILNLGGELPQKAGFNLQQQANNKIITEIQKEQQNEALKVETPQNEEEEKLPNEPQQVETAFNVEDTLPLKKEMKLEDSLPLKKETQLEDNQLLRKEIKEKKESLPQKSLIKKVMEKKFAKPDLARVMQKVAIEMQKQKEKMLAVGFSKSAPKKKSSVIQNALDPNLDKISKEDTPSVGARITSTAIVDYESGSKVPVQANIVPDTIEALTTEINLLSKQEIIVQDVTPKAKIDQPPAYLPTFKSTIKQEQALWNEACANHRKFTTSVKELIANQTISFSQTTKEKMKVIIDQQSQSAMNFLEVKTLLSTQINNVTDEGDCVRPDLLDSLVTNQMDVLDQMIGEKKKVDKLVKALEKEAETIQRLKELRQYKEIVAYKGEFSGNMKKSLDLVRSKLNSRNVKE